MFSYPNRKTISIIGANKDIKEKKKNRKNNEDEKEMDIKIIHETKNKIREYLKKKKENM